MFAIISGVGLKFTQLSFGFLQMHCFAKSVPLIVDVMSRFRDLVFNKLTALKILSESAFACGKEEENFKNKFRQI